MRSDHYQNTSELGEPRPHALLSTWRGQQLSLIKVVTTEEEYYIPFHTVVNMEECHPWNTQMPSGLDWVRRWLR